MTIVPSLSSRSAWLMTTRVMAPKTAANKASTPVLSGNESIAPPQTAHGLPGRPQIYPELRQETQLAAPCPATFLRIANFRGPAKGSRRASPLTLNCETSPMSEAEPVGCVFKILVRVSLRDRDPPASCRGSRRIG